MNAEPFRVLRYPKIAHAAASTAIPVRCSGNEGRFLGSRGGELNRDLGRRGGSRTLTLSELVSSRASLTRKRFLGKNAMRFRSLGDAAGIDAGQFHETRLHRALRRGATARRPVSADLIGKLRAVGRLSSSPNRNALRASRRMRG